MAQFKGTIKADKNNGTKDNDSITGEAGNDVLSGGLGNDFIDGGKDNDLLNGENGSDTLSGGDGKDTLNGGSGHDKLDGGKHDDKLFGDEGNDTLNGGVGVDVMTGGSGNDYFFVDNYKDSVIETNEAGSGNDTVESVLLNYTLTANVENLILAGNDASNGAGNLFDNSIKGNSANNYLRGYEGNDKLVGNAGVDTLDGGLGMDTLIGGDDSDIYFIDNIEDSIIENLNGGRADKINVTMSFSLTSALNVEYLELSGDQAIEGTGNELDNLIQEKSDGNIANYLSGMEGNDTLNSAGGDDTLEGGDGNDILNGSEGNDTAIYNDLQKNYQITPNVGSDGVAQLIVRYIGAGTDTNNKDSIDAITEGTDILSNIEIIQFSDGSEINAADVVSGAIVMDAPEETVVETTAKPVVTPTVSPDKFEIQATKPPADMVFDWDFEQTENAETLDLGSLPSAINVRIMALGGNDTLQGGSAVRWIDGGDGNDSILGGDGTVDTLLGGAGDDFLSAGSYYNVSTYYGYSQSYSYNDSAKNVLSGGLGNDVLYGGQVDDILIGGDGNDRLVGEGEINGTGTGNGSGNDTLIGGAGNDILFGYEGNDTLNGGTGVDYLNGGGGADVFVFATGDSGVGSPVVKKSVSIPQRDVITDFDVPSDDVLDLSAIANGKLSYQAMKPFSGNNQVRYEFDFTTTTTIVKLNLDNDPKTTEMEIELTGFKNLTADDFVLVKP